MTERPLPTKPLVPKSGSTSFFPERFLEAMGTLAIEYGRVEYIAKLVFKQLHGLPFSEGMAQAEGHRQFSMICEKILEAANSKLTDSTQRDKLTEVMTDLKELALERHDMVHAMWYANPDGSMNRSRIELDRKTGKLDWSKSAQFTAGHLKTLAWQVQVCREHLHAMRKTWPQMGADAS
jgi:hypothetical protein